ncbi:MAG: hypothetical protein ACT4PY_13100 [Armatimonadota bacterium]
MALTEHEAYTRLREASRRIAPALIVDRGSIHWVDGPLPGVEYNLLLGDAHALLFMPASDIDTPGWETRLAERLASAHRYLSGFPHPAR